MGNVEQGQLNKSKLVATKMYNVADRVDGTKQPELHLAFSEAANEFANEGYDKGQRILEKGGVWNDEIRGVATEANQAGREKSGGISLNFVDAKKVISGYAAQLESSGERQDIESAMEIDSLVRGMDRPGQSGLEGIDDALKYVEGLLQTRATSERQLTPDLKKEWEKKRALRDALYAEKQKRVEQLKQKQQTGERLNSDRTSTGRALENLFSNAGLSENSPVRQTLLQKSQDMSGEELRFFNAEVRKAAGNFNAIGDPKRLETALSDLMNKNFSKEESTRRGKQEDDEELDRIRSSLNAETKLAEKFPEDRRGLFRYFRDNFKYLENTTLDEFRRKFTPELETKYQGWAQKQVESIIRDKPPGARYADTVASVLGNEGSFIQRVISAKEGRVISADEILTMPFSQVAKKYLSIDLPKDYFEHFSQR